MERIKVINFFAGPGAGKSTTAAGVFSVMKSYGIRAELVTEVAKDATWEGHSFLLSQQVSLFAEQLRRQTRLIGKRDVLVTDSPILLPALVYNTEWQHLAPLAWEAWHKFENINFFIRRVKPYDNEGRNETEEEAHAKDLKSLQVLRDNGIEFKEINGDRNGIIEVVNHYENDYPIKVGGAQTFH